MYDKERYPQAENLNFAVRADSLLRPEDWNLDSQGTQLMKEFVAASQIGGTKSDASKTSSFALGNSQVLPYQPKPR
jgi:uncharacterized ubiquitin-like protein YukD